MPVSLTQPNEGDIGWAGAVNQNFQDIEDAINGGTGSGTVTAANSPLEIVSGGSTVQVEDFDEGEVMARMPGSGTGAPGPIDFAAMASAAGVGGGTFADGVTCVSVQSQTVGTGLSYVVASGMLANDGESLRIYSSGSATAVGLSVFGTAVLAATPGGHWTLHAVITRQSSGQVRVSILDSGPATISAISGTIAVTCSGGVVSDLKVELLTQSPYSGGNILKPVAPGTVTPGMATMPLAGAMMYSGSQAASTRVSGTASTVDENVVTSSAVVTGSSATPGANAKVWHSDGHQYAILRTASTTAAMYSRPNGSTSWTIVGSSWTCQNVALGGIYSVAGKVVAISTSGSVGRASVWDGSSLTHYDSGNNFAVYQASVHLDAIWCSTSQGSSVNTFDATALAWTDRGSPASLHGGVISHYGQVYINTAAGIYRYVSGTTWTQLGLAVATSISNHGMIGLDATTIIFGTRSTAGGATSRLYSMDTTTGTATLLPAPASWAGSFTSSWFALDDVSDPTTPTIHCFHTDSVSGVAIFPVVLSGSVSSSAASYTLANTTIVQGRLSEGRVEPRTSDVVASSISLAPASSPVLGCMELTLTIDDGGSGDHFVVELWVPGTSGGRARATLTGTATGGTRVGSQVTGVEDGTPMTVLWDCAADGFTDGTPLTPAPFVRLYREP